MEATLRNKDGLWFWNFTDDTFPLEHRPGPWLPIYQTYPTYILAGTAWTNYNARNGPRINNAYVLASATKSPAMEFLVNIHPDDPRLDKLESQIMHPIFTEVPDLDDHDKTKIEDRPDPVGYLHVAIDWVTYFENLLPDNANGIIAVLKSPCDGVGYDGVAVTYEINGLNAVSMGSGDLHDPKYDDRVVSAPFVQFDYPDNVEELTGGIDCMPQLSLFLYPSKRFEDSYRTNEALIYTLAVLAIFGFTALVFAIYDFSVRRRQIAVMTRVTQQHRIVANMFPTKIRDRLYAHTSRDREEDFVDLLDPENPSPSSSDAPALADLFLKTTVIFAVRMESCSHD